MSIESARTMAQVLPALLVAGLLVPILIRADYWPWPERGWIRGQVLTVGIVELALIYYVVNDEEVPSIWAGLSWVAAMYSVSAVVLVAAVWAKKSEAERVAQRERKAVAKHRRSVRKRAKRIASLGADEVTKVEHRLADG